MAKLDDILRTGQGRVLTLEDVKDNFNDYNFIITLNHDVIDTSIYYNCHHQKTQLTGVIPSSDTKGWLVLTTLKTLTSNNISDTPTAKGETRIVIFEQNVVDIKVKSKRDFLLNQKK